MESAYIKIPEDVLKHFCLKWSITEFAFFGSVLRNDFRSDSDIDVLVSFKNDAGWSLWDLLTMKEELEKIFGRPVDLVEKRAMRNPFRRHEILRTQRVVYAA